MQQTFQCVCLHTRTYISQLSPLFLTHNTCAQHINTRHCRTSRFVCLQPRLHSACIRKDLRPANSIKIFLGSSQSYSKFSVGTQNPHCSPPQNTALPTLSALCPNTKPAPMSPSSPCCTSQHSTSEHRTFCTYQRITLLSAYLYKKDERSLPLNLQSSEQQTPLIPRLPPYPPML